MLGFNPLASAPLAATGANPSAPANHYVFTADPGSFALAAPACPMHKVWKLPTPATGSFALTGVDVRLYLVYYFKFGASNYGRFTFGYPTATLLKFGTFNLYPRGVGTFTLTADTNGVLALNRGSVASGVYTLSAQPGIFRSTVDQDLGNTALFASGWFNMPAGAGSFATTFNFAGCLLQYMMLTSSPPTAFTLSLVPPAAYVQRYIQLAAGQFTFTGDSETQAPRYSFTGLLPGAFTVAGVAENHHFQRGVSSPSPGVFLIRGGAWNARINRTLNETAGSFTYAGQAITFASAFHAALSSGSFHLSGQPERLAHNRVLPEAAGTYALTGEPVAATQAPKLSAGRGNFLLGAPPVALAYDRHLTAAAGAYLVTITASMHANFKLPRAAGTFTLAGQPETLAHGRKLPVATGTYTLVGNAVQVGASLPHLTAAAGAFALTGDVVLIRRNRTLSADRGAFRLVAWNDAKLYTGAQGLPDGPRWIANSSTSTIEHYGALPVLEPRNGLIAQPGSFLVSCPLAALGKALYPAAGSFALTGHDVGMQ